VISPRPESSENILKIPQKPQQLLVIPPEEENSENIPNAPEKLQRNVNVIPKLFHIHAYGDIVGKDPPRRDLTPSKPENGPFYLIRSKRSGSLHIVPREKLGALGDAPLPSPDSPSPPRAVRLGGREEGEGWETDRAHRAWGWMKAMVTGLDWLLRKKTTWKALFFSLCCTPLLAVPLARVLHRARNGASSCIRAWGVERTANLYIAFLGLVYMRAYTSLDKQILGMVGSEGVSSVSDYIRDLKTRVATQDYKDPSSQATLHRLQERAELGMWNFAGRLGLKPDRVLSLMCKTGAIAGAACTLASRGGKWKGWAYVRPVSFLVCYWNYLIFRKVANDFMQTLPDALLLEASILSIPLTWPSRHPISTAVNFWLLRVLLFKVMLNSGIAKFRERCPKWLSLSAMCYHYETQPMPTMLAPYLHSLPVSIHHATTAITLLLEVLAPFLLLLPSRRAWAAAFFLFSILSASIHLSGNVGVFNILTIVLSLAALDDATLPQSILRMIPPPPLPFATSPSERFGRSIHVGFTIWTTLPMLIALGLPILTLPHSKTPLGGLLRKPVVQVPGWALSIYVALLPTWLGQAYSPFARIVPYRWEPVVETLGEDDEWHEVNFPAFGGSGRGGLGLNLGHEWRIDQAMQSWPSSLAEGKPPPEWFRRLVYRILTHSPHIHSILKYPPPPATSPPPRAVRVSVFDCHFRGCKLHHRPDVGIGYSSPPSLRRAEMGGYSSHWWRRKVRNLLTVTLRDGQIAPVDDGGHSLGAFHSLIRGAVELVSTSSDVVDTENDVDGDVDSGNVPPLRPSDAVALAGMLELLRSPQPEGGMGLPRVVCDDPVLIARVLEVIQGVTAGMVGAGAGELKENLDIDDCLGSDMDIYTDLNSNVQSGETYGITGVDSDVESMTPSVRDPSQQAD